MYRHFKDWEGLLEAFAAERTPRSFAPELALAGSDLYGDLHRLTMAALRFLLDHPALLRSIGAPQTADRRMRPDSRSLRTVLQSYLRKQIEAGRVRGDPRVITHSLLGLTFGAIMFDRDATETNPDESAAAIVDILLHGCATRRTRRRK